MKEQHKKISDIQEKGNKLNNFDVLEMNRSKSPNEQSCY